jgi:hypothetical protein
MTPAFTTKCLVRICSPNKQGWQWLSIRDHETDRGRRSLARQGLRPRGRKSVAGDGRFVERLASFTAVGWQFGIQAGGRPVSRAMATSQCGQFLPVGFVTCPSACEPAADNQDPRPYMITVHQRLRVTSTCSNQRQGSRCHLQQRNPLQTRVDGQTGRQQRSALQDTAAIAENAMAVDRWWG